MSERVRQLLDQAVAGLEPRTTDPTPTVLRRGRTARLRVVSASALAVLAVAAGGVGMAVHLDADPVPVQVGAQGEPPTPRLVAGEIVAGDVVLPVPAGWRVVRAGSGPCGTEERTVVIGGPQERGCLASIEIYGAYNMVPPALGFVPGGSGHDLVPGPPQVVTLAGGEPAWLTHDTATLHGSDGYFNELALPWSQLRIVFRFDGSAQQRFIDSIRTTPRPTTRLALPRTVVRAALAASAQSDDARNGGYAQSTDPRTIAAALRLLDRQSIVDNRHACASDSQTTVGLTLVEKVAPANPSITSHPPVPTTSAPADVPDKDKTWVVITLGDKCREAISSRGGRVRLDEAAFAELTELFGLGSR